MTIYSEEPAGPEELEPEVEGQQGPPPRTRQALVGSLLALAALLAFHGVQLAAWNRSDSRPVSAAQAGQLQAAAQCGREGLRRAWACEPEPGAPPAPPLYPLSIGPFASAEDPLPAVRWVGFAYLAALCLCAWGLGRHFLGDWAGFGAAVLISCIPESQALLRDPSPDLAAAAWVAAAYWALAESHAFARRGFSALFGVLFAAGLLTKWTAFSYCLPALWPAGRALSDPGRRKNAALALLLCAGLAGPWFLRHGGALLAGLVFAAAAPGPWAQAPGWTVPGLSAYLGKMIGGMDFPLFLVAMVSAVVPSVRRRREHAGLLVAWFAVSYLFWSLVPDRRMGLLLPAITPLAVLSMGPWPRAVSAGICALQLFAAFNYPRSLVPPRTIETVAPLSFFRSDPARKEDWKQREILQGAAGIHVEGADGALTVLADHPGLNAGNLERERRRLGLERLAVRGPSARVCEFSEFLLTKTGSLGPGDRARKLEEARKALEDGGWFKLGWAQAGRWSLPDGSEAVLYARRRPADPPFSERRLRLDYIEEKGWATEGLEIDFGDWDAARGVYPRTSLRAASLTWGGLRIAGLRAELEDVFPVPILEGPGDPKKGMASPTDFRFARLGRVRLLAAEVSADDAREWLKGLGRGVRSAGVRFEKDAVLAVDVQGLPLALEWSAAVEKAGGGRVPVLSLRRLGVAGLAVPGSVLGPGARIALERGPRGLPFELDVPSIRMSDGFLRIGG